ncbi:phosphate ABC transporter permease subunit PstC [Fannyhessea vaginae]|jgi:phosphate ABC transporter, permease protein pstC|uniref:phosphate ABC transporter permease subunit PstC n=1 Tax=Fannyhessea vaginae TaxID=82135 RepID=UPI0023F4D035|nr:phosphate ABC transporter permease subunit PstC [Fannyhessea vaginae]
MLLHQKQRIQERVAQTVCAACACIAVLAVASISVYILISGLPALIRIGIDHMLFGVQWSPTTNPPVFGIGYIILASALATMVSVCIGLPLSIAVSIYITELAPTRVAAVVSSFIELLAGIPSVIYGLVGMVVLCPLLYRTELVIYSNDPAHQYSGGSNMLACVCVLAIMVLPTMIGMSVSALRSVPTSLRASSYALGATRIQTIVKVVIPAAKSGIFAAIVLGVGRALGEAMAISMVAGGGVNLPLPFASVRLLTTQLVSEMSYAQGLHKEALFAVGVVLYVFIICINSIVLLTKRKKHCYGE